MSVVFCLFFFKVVWFSVLFMVARQGFSNVSDTFKFGGIGTILVEYAGPSSKWIEESCFHLFKAKLKFNTEGRDGPLHCHCSLLADALFY